MEQKWETVLYEKIDPAVAKITMNRPEYLNAQHLQLTYELDAAYKEAAEDDDIRVIVLAGAGRAFSAGHDLGTPEGKAEEERNPRKPGIEARWHREVEIYIDTCFRWRDIPKATIAQVHGWCIAGGAMLAACCDLIIASEDAKFSDPVARMGIGGVEYFFHPWDLGARKAKEILFTGDYLTAQEAWMRGFVNKVVPMDKLDEEVMIMAKKIVAMPRYGIQLAKASVNDTLDMMGFRNSIMNTFKAHQLAHAFNAEMSGGASVVNNPITDRKK